MEIVKKPATFNFAGNISDIVVRTTVPMDFKLFVLNGGQLLDERYVPINGEVTIRVRDLLEKVAPAASIGAGFIELPLYIWAVGDLPAEQFRCIRGGHQAATDSEAFAKSNFLTWQPQTRRVNYHTPLRLSYAALGACDVMVRGYFSNGTTNEVTIRSLLPNTLHTIDVSYGTVAGLFGGVYPNYYDVWVEGAGIKSYTQRYMYGTPSDNADEFMWINSLGGVDTAIFTGDLKRELKYESITALFDRSESEFEIDAKRVYTKWTGYLPSKNEQLWALDFFYSTARYHNDDGALRQIIVSSPKTQATRGELSGYEFSFAHSTQSPYLNLPRLAVPELLAIEEPDGEVFFLAPRLALFDVAEIGVGDVLIPVQYASSTRWLHLPLADILRLIVSGGGSGAPQAHAMSHAQGGSDPIGPYSIGAAKINGDRYKNFAAQDFTARNATVAEDVKATNVYASKKVVSPFIASPEFLGAMLGYGFGGYVDENGESHLWADHLHGRASFETLEMRYRKLLVSGEDLLVSSGGVVDEVLPYGQTLLSTTDGRLIITQDRRAIYWPSNGRVVFKLKGEPGIDLQQFVVDDILRYTWRDTDTGDEGASGWLRVKHCFDTFWYEGEVVSGSPEWLQKGMTTGQMGNYTKKDRQGFINISGRDKQIAIWDEVDGHILKPSMLKVYLGDLRYVTDPELPEMGGFGLYSINAFLKGVFVLRSSGKTIETEFSIRDKEISSRVKNGDFETYKKQTAEGFEQTVKKGDVISSINQSAETITLDSKRINLNGAVTANGNVRILPNGRIEAKNANISGKIQATSGQFKNVVVNGSIRNSFQDGHYVIGSDGPISISTYGVNNNNNIVIPGSGGPYVYTMFEVPFDNPDNSGFRVTILNEDFKGYSATGVIKANAPADKYFYENGIAWSSLQIGAHEGIDMIGFGDGDKFNGWIVIRRFGSKTTPSHLMYHPDTLVEIPGVTLCLGTANEKGQVLSQWGPVYCGGQRSTEGERHYTITHNLNHTDYHLDVAPYRKGDGSCHFTYAMVSKGASSVTFAIVFSDSNVPADTYFDFKLCGRNKA